MKPCPTASTACLVAMLLLLAAWPGAAAPGDAVAFDRAGSRLAVTVGGAPFATYVWKDAQVSRPYFAHLCVPGAGQVTRNFPPDPVADRDNDDHATYHPGAWLAFGDINGADDWRLKAPVVHERFAEEPAGGAGEGRFAVVNTYRDADGAVICEEFCRYTIRVTDWGVLLVSESIFSSRKGDFAFGDQEEMGLGVRLATALTVRHGNGTIVNSEGGRDEAGTWGQAADWCAGHGVVDGRRLGVSVMPDPGNFRPSWYHSRDYGLIVANPFGKKAMTGPKEDAVKPDRTEVKGATGVLTLGFGLGFFEADPDGDPPLEKVYADYLAFVGR